MGDGVVDVVGGGDHQLLLEPLPVVDGALRLRDDLQHGGQSLHRVLASGSLPGEHDAAGSIVNGVGHVRDLRPGGAGVAHHGVQHLGGRNHRFARLKALADHLLLEGGDLGGGNLHPQIAPGHHDPVGGGQDVVDVVDALLVFNFGDDFYIVPAAVVEHLPDGLHIGGPADKGGGDEVEIVLHAEADVRHVLLRQGGELDVGPGDVDGLVVGQGSAVLHLADDVAAPDFPDPQGDQAVVNQNLLTGGHLLVELGVGDGDPGRVAGRVLHREGEGLSGGELHGLGLKALDADLRALGVQNGGHGAAHPVPDGLQAVQPLQMLRVAAVGKVEPGAVHAALDQGDDHFLAVHGGAQGTDNFCFSQHMKFLLGFPLGIRNLKARSCNSLLYKSLPLLGRLEFHKFYVIV